MLSAASGCHAVGGSAVGWGHSYGVRRRGNVVVFLRTLTHILMH